MANTNTIDLAVANPEADNAPVIFATVTATLNVTLTNSTGADIQLDATSTIEIFLPTYFTDTQVEQVTATGMSLPGWSFTNTGYSIKLSCGSSSAWQDGTPFTFSLQNVVATASPQSGQMTFNFANLTGRNIPLSLNQNLTLNAKPVITQPNLVDALQANLDNQGSVFVSVSTDPLTNTLFLNLKNTTGGNLYTGTGMWQANPKVIVTFVYGSNSGSLAANVNGTTPPVGSAWNIVASIFSDPNGWATKAPDPQAASPSWTLYPTATNLPIIGTQDKANQTFVFSNIVSLTAPGHTQMYVQCTGFPKDQNTLYNDCLFVIDIVKQQAPPTRGLLNFFSPTAIQTITQPTSNLQVSLRWSMFYVDQVTLISSAPGVVPVSRSYPAGTTNPVNQDNATISLPGTISQNTSLFFTLQSFSANGGFLNSMQFAVLIKAAFFADQAGKIYPTVTINNVTWLAQNLAYTAPTGSRSNGTSGTLYTLAAALQSAPAGWRLPTQQEWAGLINFLGGGQKAYTALMTGGSNNFSAMLGGYADQNGTFNNAGTAGYYWSGSAAASANNQFCATVFTGPPFSSVNANSNSYLSTCMLSVRYVKIT